MLSVFPLIPASSKGVGSASRSMKDRSVPSTFGRQWACIMRDVRACLRVGSLMDRSAHGMSIFLHSGKSAVLHEMTGWYSHVFEIGLYAFILGM